jgi:hypothetical protein
MAQEIHATALPIRRSYDKSSQVNNSIDRASLSSSLSITLLHARAS